MSRTVDLFIDAVVPVEDLARTVGKTIGTELRHDPGSSAWLLGEGNVEATLSAHPYVDDGDLLFTHYRYVLSASVDNDVRPQDSAEAAYLREVADKLQRDAGLSVLLVLDLQYRDPADAASHRGGSSEHADGSEPGS
jgi:hypothetical protein